MKTLLTVGIGLLIMSAIIKRLLPRGIRNNNPGNIRRTNDQWQGMRVIQTDRAFVQFKNPEYGFRAMARILKSYERRGLLSVRDIIGTYAPALENKTEMYIDFVATQLNVPSDAPLNLEENLFPLIKAITTFENGPLYEEFYDDQTIASGIALA